MIAKDITTILINSKVKPKKFLNITKNKDNEQKNIHQNILVLLFFQILNLLTTKSITLKQKKINIKIRNKIVFYLPK